MSVDYFTPHDMTDGLAEAADFEQARGNGAGASMLKASLVVITKFSAKVAAPDPTKLYQSLTAVPTFGLSRNEILTPRLSRVKSSALKLI